MLTASFYERYFRVGIMQTSIYSCIVCTIIIISLLVLASISQGTLGFKTWCRCSTKCFYGCSKYYKHLVRDYISLLVALHG